MSAMQLLSLVAMCLIVLIFLPVYIIYVSKAWHIGKMEVLKNNFGKTEAKNGKDESKKVEEKRKQVSWKNYR
jgi:hypothetical protein